MKYAVCALALAAAACGADPEPPELPEPPEPPSPTCVAPARSRAPMTLVRAFAGLTFDQPVAMTLTENGAWWYLIERTGRVWRFENDPDVTMRELVLDISTDVDFAGDNGLVAIALHPEFDSNGLVFLSYTRPGKDTLLESRISRFQSFDGGVTLDPESEHVVLSIEQTINIHVNGDMSFGPDGYLYVGFGDGTEVGTSYSPAIDSGHLAGTILRLDIDGASPYAIPPDNPFASGGGAPEVYAYGLRNPWRFSFDRETGDLWAGDVGWATWEEIDVIVSGGNYGWNTYEAHVCIAPERCDQPGLIPPVVSMHHDESRSITAGYVYRGTGIPSLRGMFVFGDFIAGVIWAVDSQLPGPVPLVLSTDGQAITSFAEDADGELYVVDLVDGTLWSMVESDERSAHDDAAPLLSETGCFGERGAPRAGLVPYEINWPFFSDHALKRRWISIPEGTSIEVRLDGELVFPSGSVLLKEFWLGDRRVETRLFVRHEDGAWAGYTYIWRADQSDADLVPFSAGEQVRTWGDQRWHYPSRSECLQCHTAEVGRAIGPKVAQLNRTVTNGEGAVVNQLEWFRELKLIGELPQPLEELPALPAIEDASHSVSDRARSWLHANCSNCHRPGQATRANLDLRFTVSLADTGICDEVPSLGTIGIDDARIIAPGAPERSVLLARIRSLDAWRMPPTSAEMSDEEGTALVEKWIRSLTSCE